MCVSGDVMKPGFYELPAGAVTLGELIFDVCGGLRPGRKLKAVIPGGSSAKVMRADDVYKIKVKNAEGKMVDKEMKMLDVVMDAAGRVGGNDGWQRRRDDHGRSRDMVWALNNLNQFYANESCGQCTRAARSLWMSKITTECSMGRAEQRPEGSQERGGQHRRRTVCAFGEACSWPTQSFLAKFPEEFDALAARGEFRVES